jgi:competence protein ComEC
VSKAIVEAGRRGVRLRFARELCGVHPLGLPPSTDGPRATGSIEVLGPCPSFVPGRHVNDNSLVVRIRWGRRAVLLTGDAEKEQEASLVARHARRLSADLLKVGHHGSRTSSTRPFLASVAPSLAIASCGARNRFGHPHAETRASFAAATIPLLRTDRGGALVWETDGEELRWRRPGSPWSEGRAAEL